MSDECIFCQIAAGAAAAQVVYDGGGTFFFRDISPKAPVHVVAIPKKHITSLNGVGLTDRELLGQLMIDIAQVAQQLGVSEDGYRVIANVGGNAGQEVPHLHFHILGGEPLGPL